MVLNNLDFLLLQHCVLFCLSGVAAGKSLTGPCHSSVLIRILGQVHADRSHISLISKRSCLAIIFLSILFLVNSQNS